MGGGIGEVVQAKVNIAQGFPLNAQTSGLLRTCADEHAGIAVPEQVVNQQHRANGGVQPNLDAHGFQQLLVAFQQALGQPKFRNAIAHDAADLAVPLEDRHAVSL